MDISNEWPEMPDREFHLEKDPHYLPLPPATRKTPEKT
jgi:hypothetical protein